MNIERLKQGKKRALHLLEKRDYSRQELFARLEKDGYEQEYIEEILCYLDSFHYLDDERYAETFTRYKKEKMSRQQIKQKLMQKGVSREVIENVIDEEYDLDESIHIRKLLEKKNFSSVSVDEGEFRRMYNYLLRRGFHSNDILKEMKCVEADW